MQTSVSHPVCFLIQSSMNIMVFRGIHYTQSTYLGSLKWGYIVTNRCHKDEVSLCEFFFSPWTFFSKKGEEKKKQEKNSGNEMRCRWRKSPKNYFPSLHKVNFFSSSPHFSFTSLFFLGQSCDAVSCQKRYIHTFISTSNDLFIGVNYLSAKLLQWGDVCKWWVNECAKLKEGRKVNEGWKEAPFNESFWCVDLWEGDCNSIYSNDSI